MIDNDSHTPAVEVKKVSFSYAKLKALDNLSLQIPMGISFGLLGPNGAGKTTLIRLLVGLLQQKEGKIQILGQNQSRQMFHLIGYMPQQHSLYNELSVAQNVDFFAKIYRLKDRDERLKRVEIALRLVDLWERRNDGIMKLSGGMKQRVSLACAIVHNPPLLFLDEPTVGLDPALRANFWQHFADLNSQGVTIIVSSHTMDDAAHCNRLAFLRNGRVIAEGTPNQLRKETGEAAATLEDAFLYFVRREEKHDA
ncbi:MAG: ABC transporter ATP-binding protein [Dehalococcoidales bacterium]|nr:ABC transporter ATP-binding protein [Dehalococcoidales bacterium]